MRRDEIISLTSQIRRDMPRNKAVMALCEEIERRIMESSQVVRPDAVNVPTAGSNPASPAKRGRPRIGEVRAKPWEAVGMSRATWYRRRREAIGQTDPLVMNKLLYR